MLCCLTTVCKWACMPLQAERHIKALVLLSSEALEASSQRALKILPKTMSTLSMVCCARLTLVERLASMGPPHIPILGSQQIVWSCISPKKSHLKGVSRIYGTGGQEGVTLPAATVILLYITTAEIN